MVYPGFETVRGWCPAVKAERLEALAKSAKVCVEVGVFGGQSFFAMGYGSLTAQLFAIDPWQMLEAQQKCAAKVEERFDWEQVYRGFVADVETFGLTARTVILRMTSRKAVEQFADKSICLLHIDGNHDEDKVILDVVNWLPKVKRRGTIVLDDVDWPSVRPAFEFLNNACRLIQNYGTWAEFRVV